VSLLDIHVLGAPVLRQETQRVETVTDERGYVTRNTHDALNRRLTTTEAFGLLPARTETYGYHDVGNRTEVYDTLGTQLTSDLAVGSSATPLLVASVVLTTLAVAMFLGVGRRS